MAIFLPITFRFQEWGLEKGWGDTAGYVLEMIHLLLDVLQAPDPSTLETFLGRIPMIFNVVVVSPHGYFGQANVLGLPDTGGQVPVDDKTPRFFCLSGHSQWSLAYHGYKVPPSHHLLPLIFWSLMLLFSYAFVQIVYILDQVRALENEMVLRLKKQGLDFTPKILIVSACLFPSSNVASVKCDVLFYQ